MKYYKLKKDLPGHIIGDVLMQASDFYFWEKGVQYSMPADIIENFPKWFEKLILEYQEGEDIWYLSLNGLIISDSFQRDKHSSLIQYGNIFTSEEDAIKYNNKIKLIFKKNT